MRKKFGILLLVMVGSGIWFHNERSQDLPNSKYSDSDQITVPSPSPTFQASSPTPMSIRGAQRQPPINATAICRDGTYSYRSRRRRTCSHHGGVAQWLR